MGTGRWSRRQLVQGAGAVGQLVPTYGGAAWHTGGH
jgi:hypothetical protein